MNNLGEYQNNITELPSLVGNRYENIFKVYTTEKDRDNAYYFYNIINKVILPSIIDQELLGVIDLNTKLPWTTLSYKIYGTINLWWLIYLINKPKNIFYADPGIQYKYILPEYIDAVLNDIKAQIN